MSLTDSQLFFEFCNGPIMWEERPAPRRLDRFVLRCRRRGSVTTKKPHHYWCVYDYEGMLKQFNNTFHTHAKSQINALKVVSEL